MTSNQISYFLALSKELHYWRTSYQLNITQSSLSRHIQGLEQELNVQLFKRTKRSVELTDAGKFLKDHWEPIMEQFDATIAYAKKIEQGSLGTVSITHPGSMDHRLLPQFLSKIAGQYPLVKTELIQLRYDQEVEFLVKFKVDMAFSRYKHSSEMLDSKLIEMESFAFVVSDMHDIKSNSDLKPDILNKQRFILPALQPGYSYPALIQNIFDHYQINPSIVIESDFASTVVSLVATGIGISIVPISVSFSSVVGVKFIEIPFTIPLYLYWRKNEDNPLIRNVISLIT
ncbi:DNA-binding transcriptional LysR family regulator [Pedobacter cryoconitis]|uniref:DNA-binding transcriptional LysR family regulator n=1 Tax=Pedobacter cryoconitis TaxID=188932 RepID=A0A7W9E109_9SPHI|nr:LysR family transcriptional regulator [Pedobacter cryoconitis]MBB5639007.1 DNA-binding transcriptional LysR family regulator [Pedobacter cryoconitis]